MAAPGLADSPLPPPLPDYPETRTPHQPRAAAPAVLIRTSWPITDRAAWAARPGRDLSGSRIGAIFDCGHPFMTTAELVADLRGEGRRYTNAAMRDGRRLEPMIGDAVETRRPDWRVERVATYHWLPELRLGAIPDFWLDNDGVIEAKTVSPKQWAAWRRAPPLAYLLQLATEMLVTDRARGVLAIMSRFAPYQLHLFEIARCAAVERRILAAAADWWRHWDAGEIAPPASSEGLAELFGIAPVASCQRPTRHHPPLAGQSTTWSNPND